MFQQTFSLYSFCTLLLLILPLKFQQTFPLYNFDTLFLLLYIFATKLSPVQRTDLFLVKIKEREERNCRRQESNPRPQVQQPTP